MKNDQKLLNMVKKTKKLSNNVQKVTNFDLSVPNLCKKTTFTKKNSHLIIQSSQTKCI